MNKVLIAGLTGRGKLGSYQTQLGNVAILIPMIKLLKQYVPDVSISTNIQLTDKFCDEYGIERIPQIKGYLPYFNWVLEFLISMFNLLTTTIWNIGKKLFHINANFLIQSERNRKVIESDVVLDFNGDIFPSDVNAITALQQVIEIMTIKRLNKPIIEFVSSPGPFKTWYRQVIAKLMYRNIDLFLNREPISTELIQQLGINKPILTTACPAFLLEPASPQRGKEILSNEGVNIKNRPLIGITLSGYNLAHRTWGKRTNYDGLELYQPTLKWLLDDLKANVILLPHVYRINPYVNEYEFINGPDHDILLNLYKIVYREQYNGRLKLIEEKYTASEAKAVIGQCDMFLSGRLHVCAAALSQGIPTVLFAYGHKHKGFARLFGQEKYAYAGNDNEELLNLVKTAWENRVETKNNLQKRFPQVKELVYLNFEVVKEIMSLEKKGKFNIPINFYNNWNKRIEKLNA